MSGVNSVIKHVCNVVIFKHSSHRCHKKIKSIIFYASLLIRILDERELLRPYIVCVTVITIFF